MEFCDSCQKEVPWVNFREHFDRCKQEQLNLLRELARSTDQKCPLCTQHLVLKSMSEQTEATGDTRF